MGVSSINSLDIISGKLLSPGYIVASWADEQLIWNSSDFNNLEHLTLTADDIWTPQFVQFGATDAKFDLSNVWLHDNGTVLAIMAGIFEAVCKLDVLHFPFDQHQCEFEIISAASDASEIQLKISSTNNSIEHVLEHGEWEVTGSRLFSHEFTEPISGKTFVTLFKILSISRRYQFITVHTCLPLLLLTLLNMIVFVVPLRSGERISFSTSVLLNFVFLTSNVSENLPHNSLRLPYMSILMMATNIITTFGVIISVLLCRLDYETLFPIPDCVKNIASRYIACRIHKWRRKTEDKPNTTDPDEISDTESTVPKTQERNEVAGVEVTWSVIAEMIDKIIFYINFVAVITILTVFLSLIIKV